MGLIDKDKTLAEHAEAWWKEQGNIIPPKNTKKWNEMYKKWIEFAFKDFKEI